MPTPRPPVMRGGSVDPPPPSEAGSPPARQAPTGFADAHFAALATAVLTLAAFNVGFRLNREFVMLWDESLYATSATEMLRSGHWIATTFQGALDYYNSKPPLAVWLIALAFKVLGPGLVALRLPSALAAWTTIAVLMRWTRRTYGAATAIATGLVLSTTFGFIRIHAARSAATDALFTLLVVLTVVTLSAARRSPRLFAWIGPILAAAFLLRGMAVLMPLAIVLGAEVMGARTRPIRWWPRATAVLLFAGPVLAWIAARWEIDRGAFLERLFFYDFVTASITPVEGHAGGLLYYFDLLQRNQYDWLIASLAALVAIATARGPRRAEARRPTWAQGATAIVLFWGAVTFVVPTVMRTKLPWYLNPFYPVFALAVATLVVRAFGSAAASRCRWRSAALGGVIVLCATVAETKLLWYSFHNRDLASSVQGFILAERDRLAGHLVFRRQWDYADRFVLRDILGARGRIAADADDFLRVSQDGDYLVTSRRLAHERLRLIRAEGGYWLYQHRESD